MIQLKWTSTERLLREALAEVEKPRSSERANRLRELTRAVLKDPAFSTMTQIIGEAEGREAVDTALALLIASATIDLDNPQPFPSSAGFATEVTYEEIGFRLLVPEPSPVLFSRLRHLEE